MVQWLRIRLAMPGTWTQSLVRELRPPHAAGELSLQATAVESVRCNTRPTCAETKTQHSQINKQKTTSHQSGLLC